MTVSQFVPDSTAREHTQPMAQNLNSIIIGTSKKIFIQTQGCQMNEYDSQKMADLLAESHGCERTNDPAKADILVLNTCSIREKAQEKVFSELGRWRKHKDENPDVVIAVGGCVASQEGGAIQKRAPYVDIVFGPQTLHRLPQMLDQHEDQKRSTHKIKLVDISFPDIEKFDFMPEPRVDGVKAFVSIMEGCSKYCSFCVVPYTRGEEVSRPLEDVISEIASLSAQGVREVTLLGQNVNGYRGGTADGTICNFAQLLHLVAKIPGIGRIRYTTSHPLEFSDELIAAYASIPQLVSHLHLPVQSGSNTILAAMKRNHTIDHYIETIAKLRTVRPDLHLSSDFIIGFPGEDEREFSDTLNLVIDLKFDHSYSFIFSKRPGTPAAELFDTTPEPTKKERLARLKAAIKQQTINHTDAMLGKTFSVLVEKASADNADMLIGSADNTRLVQFFGPTQLIGQFVNVRIDRINSMNLVSGTYCE